VVWFPAKQGVPGGGAWRPERLDQRKVAINVVRYIVIPFRDSVYSFWNSVPICRPQIGNEESQVHRVHRKQLCGSLAAFRNECNCESHFQHNKSRALVTVSHHLRSLPVGGSMCVYEIRLLTLRVPVFNKLMTLIPEVARTRRRATIKWYSAVLSINK